MCNDNNVFSCKGVYGVSLCISLFKKCISPESYFYDMTITCKTFFSYHKNKKDSKKHDFKTTNILLKFLKHPVQYED